VHESPPESIHRVLTDIVVISQSENDLGTTDIVTDNDTADAKPICERFRRYPPAHMEAISQQGVIQPTSSSCLIHLVLFL